MNSDRLNSSTAQNGAVKIDLCAANRGIRSTKTDTGSSVVQVPVAKLRTPPENDLVYGIINLDDPDIMALAASIKRHGILEPLVISKDHFVLSGNRRRVASILANVQRVPCRVEDITRDDPDFIARLVAFNGQRIKNVRQIAHEIAVTTDPEVAHRELVIARQENPHIRASTLELGDYRHRSEIIGNRPMADACLKIVREMAGYLPLSDRQIHYLLLNDPPRIHRSKPGRYANDLKSYRTLTNVLTRLRIAGEIDMEAIADETRPVTTWAVFNNPQDYLRSELNSFLTDYWRNLQQSQKDHIELVVEKMTLQSLLRSVAAEFTLPMTVGRGFSSLPPRHRMVERFQKSGKDKLVVVIVSDLDPAGMTIAESFGRSLRDDFCMNEDRLVCVKAALTIEQVRELHLPAGPLVKPTAATAGEFIARYGRHVWELEAVPPEKLKSIVRDTLLSVMDIKTLNTERVMEVKEARQITGYRKAVLQIFDHGQELGMGVQL